MRVELSTPPNPLWAFFPEAEYDSPPTDTEDNFAVIAVPTPTPPAVPQNSFDEIFFGQVFEMEV